ncbi:hypothetical protein ICW40_11965 [Actinotalea ferrariae]|uniref:SCO4402 family protein n=1 Tax=Actinotalea ferrariae TaxID=1386098 RepID=UPI001C8CDD8D|nr:hypothetical protein [Actinotalea ferrariae]MBX9245518.1 hypothetical protein [Actinotalea ferrariae]
MATVDAGLIERLLVEGAVDWLAASWIYSETSQAGPARPEDRRVMAIGAVAYLMYRGLAVPGDVTREGFSRWGSSTNESFERILREWHAIPFGEERPGDVVWLDLTDEGAALAREAIARHDTRTGGVERREPPAARYPMMRLQIVSSVAALSDVEYQRRVWVNREWPVEEHYDDAQQSIEWLLENTQALEEPESLVGIMLFPDEVLPMSALAARLVPLVEDIGMVESTVFIADPRWAGVVEAAARVRAAMERNGGFPLPPRGLAPVPPTRPS